MEQTLASPSPNRDLKDVARRSCRDEYTDYTVYIALSRYERNERFKEALKGLGEMERAHFEFWKKYGESLLPTDLIGSIHEAIRVPGREGS